MKRLFSAVIILFMTFSIVSCNDKGNSVQSPIYDGEITLKEGSTDVEDSGCAGQSTPDGKFSYHGRVTLYTESGFSEVFECFEGKEGMDKGCRGIIVHGIFYNLDRNNWITIDGITYKASGILD